MRVPVYEQQQVAPQQVGLPDYAPRAASDAGLREGLSDFGRGVDAIKTRMQRDDERAQAAKAKMEDERLAAAGIARQKAIAAEATDAETNLTRGITEDLHGSQTKEGAAPGRQEGYLSLRGRDAEAGAAHFMERIEKRREAIADNLNDEEAKQIFKLRTNQDIANARATIETHAARQREAADVATLNARKDAALEAVRANPNDKDAERQVIALEGPIKALGLSEEDKAADVQKWHATVAANQIAAQIEGGDWPSAEATLKEKGALLPSAVSKSFATQIGRRKVEATAEGAAARISHEASLPNGRIDEAKALDLLDHSDMPDEAKKEARSRLDRRIVESEKAFTQNVAQHYGGAFSTYLRTNDLGKVPNSARDWLIDNAPEKWDELLQKQRRDRDRQRTLSKEHETDGERRALVALESDVVRNPDKYAEMTPEEFDSEWGSKLSPSGYKRGGSLYAGASKGDRVSDGEFSSYVNNLVRTSGALLVQNPNDKREKLAKTQLADGVRADFGAARRAFKDEHKRNPSMTEVQAPEFQKQIWLNLMRRSGIKLGDTPDVPAGGMVLPEMDFSDTHDVPKGTGVFKTDKNGVRWEKMSDGSGRRVD